MDEGSFFPFVFGWCLIGGVGGYLIGEKRGRVTEGLLFGALLGVIGWLLLLVGPDQRRKCPECLGAVPAAAKKCLHCGSLLFPNHVSPALPEVIEITGGVGFPCPRCKTQLTAPTAMRGLSLTCHGCQEMVPVP